MRELLSTLFDAESLKDESGAKSSIRRAVLIQLILIAAVVFAGFFFSIWKNQIGRDFCVAVLGLLGLSSTGTAWAGQVKSKDVLVAASSTNPFASSAQTASTTTATVDPSGVSGSPSTAIHPSTASVASSVETSNAMRDPSHAPNLDSGRCLAEQQKSLKRTNRKTFAKVLRVISLMSSLDSLAPRTIPQPPFVFLSKNSVESAVNDMVAQHQRAFVDVSGA